MKTPDPIEELTDALNRNTASSHRIEQKLDVLTKATSELWTAIRTYTELMRKIYEELMERGRKK